MQKSLGEGILAIMDRTEEVIASPAPRKGAVSPVEAALIKAMGAKQGDGSSGGAQKHRQFTEADLNESREILCKAVADKKLTMFEASKAETQINKSIRTPGFQIDPKFVSILREGAR
jgi:hypothetical protein